jgi:hypothetical protein
MMMMDAYQFLEFLKLLDFPSNLQDDYPNHLVDLSRFSSACISHYPK